MATISRFFEGLGFKLRNDRNSWGATNGAAVMLRTWDDEMRASPRRVLVLNNEVRPPGTTRTGRNERKVHLRAMWQGGIPAYTVIVTPKYNEADGSRNIGEFRPDAVFPISHLLEEDNSIYAVLGAPVDVGKLAEHMQSHKLEPNSSPFPRALNDSNPNETTDVVGKSAYIAEAVRTYLIDAATRLSTVRYGDLYDLFDLNRYTVLPVLEEVGNRCLADGDPILTALVVYKGGKLAGRCGPGFKNTFHVDEDEERSNVFRRWPPAGAQTDQPTNRAWTDEELQASVECYREMMRLEGAGTPYVKAHYYSRLAERFARAAGAFERRMQNISFLLDSRGLEWLPGLKPQQNIGTNVEPRLLAILRELLDELTPTIEIAEELPDAENVVEGAKKQITVNAYERDPTAKPRCIKKWGTTCVVCAFDFHAAYGDLGKGFIHVHHLRPIHTIGESYELDPENDLRPVCPNCHAMLHRKKEVLSIEELINHLKWKFEGSPVRS